MEQEQARRSAILLELVDRLRENGSWTGETHIQKAVFFLQELEGERLGFEFIMYVHGPFSFDLRDELSLLRAYGLIDLEPKEPYGPKFCVTPAGESWKGRFPELIEKRPAVERAARFAGKRDAKALERLASALYVMREREEAGEKEWVRRICEIKPHISEDEAKAALAEVTEGLKQEEASR